MAGFYVRRGENIVGPLETAKLRELVAAGRLLPSDEIARDVTGPWTAAERTPLFAKPPTPPEQATAIAKAEVRPPAVQPADRTDSQPPAIIDEPPRKESRIATVARIGKTVATSTGQGILITASKFSAMLSESAKRRHEIRLAKIQAEALKAQHRPPSWPSRSAEDHEIDLDRRRVELLGRPARGPRVAIR